MKIFKLPQSDPQNFGPKRVRSRKYRQLEQNGQLNLFTSGKILPLHTRSLFDEALILDERGDAEAAQKLYLKSIKAGQDTSDSYCNLGIIASEAQEYVQGITYFSLCLKHEPHHYKAHFNLANTYAEIGDSELAKLHYEVAIEMEPKFFNSYFNLGLILAKEGEYEGAINMLDQFLEIAPNEEHQPALNFIQKLRLLASSG